MTNMVLARNTMPGPTVFSDGTSRNAVVEWAGAGDPMQNDVQPVPDSVVQMIDFQRAVARGIFVIEEAPEEVQRVLGLHKQDWENRQEHARQASEQSIDLQPQDDLTMLGCIYPNGNGTTCDVQVPVRMRDQFSSPVLCGQHKQFGPQFISEITDKFFEGKPIPKWTLPRMNNLTRQS